VATPPRQNVLVDAGGVYAAGGPDIEVVRLADEEREPPRVCHG
jgi:hypothetical protein